MSKETPNKITLDLVAVEIDRGKTVISKAVPEHEVRVLKRLHVGKVKVGELTKEMEPEGEYDANAHLELARLHACYRPDNDGGISAVSEAFPNGAEDLVAYGFVLGNESDVDAIPRSVSVNEGLEERQKAAAARKAAKAEKPSKEPKGGK